MPRHPQKWPFGLIAVLPARMSDGPFFINQNLGETETAEPLDFGRRTWQDVECEYIIYLMGTRRWSITRGARTAAVNRSTFVSRIRRHGICKKN